MCCIGECIIKYVLIIGNIIFSILGLAILGLGIAAHLQLNQLRELIPINLTIISISVIVLGCVVFVIAFLACCGAILKSMWMLTCYSIIMAILAALKIYIVVVLYKFLNDAQATVADWLFEAFDNTDADGQRPAFILMETLFQCCGTTGAGSYGNSTMVPPSCCPNPVDSQWCHADDSYGGCNDIVSSWFDSFGGIVGGVMIGIIVIEALCIIFGFHVCCTIRNDKKGRITV